MTHYKRGDVVLIPFPFTDLTTAKQRPALIISSDEWNRNQADIIVCAITSQFPVEITAFEYSLPKSDILKASLPKPSKVKCGKIVTLDSRLIHKKLGAISEQSLQKILSIINTII